MDSNKLQQTDLQQTGSVNGDKELAAPALTALQGHFALRHAVLANHCGEDPGPLLKGYEKGCMPAVECMNA